MTANKGWFLKGHTPYNKGLARGSVSPDTEFKKGVAGSDHLSWKGGVQKMKNDCVYLHAGPNKRVRRPRAVYEEYHGPIPKDYVIFHIDGDKDNDDPSNLEAISRAELVRRNKRSRNL
jgi:hypothetical protein